jgi:transposase
MSRVELYAAIRRDSRVGGLSSRDLARKYRVGRRVVALALSSAWPEPRKKLPPRASRLDPWKAEIDRILRADLDAPRKQRHTTRRIFERLVAERDAGGGGRGSCRARGFSCTVLGTDAVQAAAYW